MDYDFLILDTAFLIHKPGIKKLREEFTHNAITRKQNNVIEYSVMPELYSSVGKREGCVT